MREVTKTGVGKLSNIDSDFAMSCGDKGVLVDAMSLRSTDRLMIPVPYGSAGPAELIRLQLSV